MAKAKTFVVSNATASDSSIEFKFRIRDMATQQIKVVSVKANDVMTASGKVAKAVKNNNQFVILNVTDSNGAQYVGKQLIKLNDIDIFSVLNSAQIQKIKVYANHYEENEEDIMNAISQMVRKRGISADRAMERVLENVVAGVDLMDESTAEEIVEKAENAELVVDSVYNKYANENDKEYLKEAIKEMNRYLNNWDYMSASDKRNVGATKSELKEHIKNAEARLAQLNDSQTVKDYGADKYFKVTYKAGENVYSAVMVGADTEQLARKKFIERKPTYADKIVSVTETWQGEVTSMRRRGMSVFDNSCDVKDYGEFENIEFDSSNDNMATNEVLFKYSELNGVQRRNINGLTELNFGGDWYKAVHTRVVPIGGGATYFIRMQKIKDCKLNDGWGGSYNGAIYNYDNGQWTITHKNGKVETIPGDKFDKIEEIYAYIDNFKDSVHDANTCFVIATKDQDEWYTGDSNRKFAYALKAVKKFDNRQQAEQEAQNVLGANWRDKYGVFEINSNLGAYTSMQWKPKDATWAETTMQELMKKGKENWDEDDWEAYHYIKQIEGENRVDDGFSTTDIVNRGSAIINQMWNSKQSAHQTLESPFMQSTYFKLDMDEPQDAKAEITINFEPDYDDINRGWFIIESFIKFKDGTHTKITTRTSDNPDKAIQALKEAMSKMSHSFRDSKMTCEGVSTVSDAVEVTTESGTDRIIYVMQSDVDKNLYFYIGQKYSMKDGVWTYAKFKMNGTTPDQLKSELEKAGWHAVGGGPASIIDSKEGFENYLDVYDSAEWDIHRYDALAGHARELLWKNGPSNNIIDDAINELNKLIAYLKSVKD